MGNRTPRFRFSERACVTNLRAKSNVELATLCKQQVVSTVVRRKPPKPRYNAQSLEAVLLNAAPQLPNAFQWPVEVHRCNTDETFRECPAMVSDFIVADHRTRRTPPCAQHAACNTCLVHFGQGRLYWLIRLRPRAGLPAPQ